MQFNTLGNLFSVANGSGFFELIKGTYKGYESLDDMLNTHVQGINRNFKINSEGISEFTSAQIQAKASAMGLTDSLTTELIALGKDATFTQKATTGKLTFGEALRNNIGSVEEIGDALKKSGKLDDSLIKTLNDAANKSSDAYKNQLYNIINSNAELADSFINLGDVGQKTGKSLSAMATGFAATIKPFLPLIAGVAAGIIIFAQISAYVNEFSNSIEKAVESQTKYAQSAQELESLNSEYENITQRIQELQALSESGTITLAEQQELETLQLQNAELERKIRLKQAIANQDAQKSLSDATDALSVDNVLVKTSDRQLGTYTETTPIEATQLEIQELIYLKEKRQSILDQLNNPNLNDDARTVLESQFEKTEEDIDGFTKSIDNKIELLNELVPSFQDPITGLMRSDLSSRQQKMYKDLLSVLDDFSNIDLTPTERQLNKLNKFFDGSKGKNAIKTQLLNRYREIEQIFNEENQNLIENIQNEKRKISELGVDEYSDSILNQTVQSKFGNVDMDKRTIINWSEELKETYKNALNSWGYDPEVGSIDTVFGLSDRFGEDVLKEGVEVAFTPIMDGKFLDKNTVYDYINDLVGEATIDGQFSEERLLSLDKQGKQIGDTFISGLIAATDEGLNYDNNGNWADVVGRLMHFSGKYGAISIAYKDIDKAAKKAGVSTSDFIDILSNSSDSTESLEKALQSMGLTLDDIGVDSIDTLKRYLDEAKSSAQEAAEAIQGFDGSLSSVEKAFESENADTKWSSMADYIAKAKELYDEGKVGTDDFQSVAQMISPSDIILDDSKFKADSYVEAWNSAYEKVQSWFNTEDQLGSAVNFANALEEVGLATSQYDNNGHKSFDWNFKTSAEAAKKLGTNLEVAEAAMRNLQVYGAEFDDVTFSGEQLDEYKSKLNGIKDIYDSMQEGDSKDRLGEMLKQWNQEYSLFEEDLSTLTEDQIIKITFEYDLASLQLTIDELQDKWNLGNTSAEAGAELLSSKKAYREKREEMTGYDEADSQGYEAASNKILSLQASFNENMTKAAREATQNQISAILDMQNAFQDAYADGETPDWETFLGSDKAKTVMDKIISDTKMTKKELASLFNLDESFFETEPVHIKLEGEINQSQLESQIQNMTFGSTITFNADVQGAEQEVNVIKKLDGSITYVALVDNIPTEVEPVKHQNGTISYEPITNDVEAEASKTDGGTRETNFNPNTESVDAETAKTDGGERTTIYNPFTDLLPTYFDPIIRKVIYQKVEEGTGTQATGTMSAPAYANGTTGYNVVNTISGRAYADGKISLPEDETALVNELGRESFIRDGKWMLLPPGMHLQGFKKGDIILSASQTEALMKYGRASGKGNAYANGTIPPSVLTNAYGNGWRVPSSSNSSSDSYSYSNSSSSSSNSNSNSNSTPVSNEEAKDTADTLDWIETLLKRIQDAIESLGKKASSVFKTWKNRNSALVEQMKKVNEEIALQEQAYNRYLAETEPIGLSDHYKELVRNGAIDIELVSDETLKENIQNFQAWYEKALECEKALEDLKETAAELNKTKFDNVVSEFEQLLNKFNYQKNMMDEYMNQMAAHGYQTSTRYYQSKLIAESNSIKELEKQRNAMLVEFESAMLSGTIEKGSEAWYDMANQIDEVTVAIEEGHTAMLEYKKEIRDIEWGYFDLLQERITQITNEAEFLIDLMGNKKLYDDKGQLTDEGMATMGLYGQNYNVYMEQSKRYAEEIKRIDKELAGDPYNQDLINRRNELLEQQREMILSAEQQKDAIVNLVKEGIELELESLKKLIDETNEALNSQKD